jgi:hypothetical protein
MPTVALTTFLKLSDKAPAAKATAYGKYLEPGGYDFYWRLKAMARALTVKGKPYLECEKILQGIKDETKRKHNLSGLKSLAQWLEKEKDTKFFAPPAALCVTPKGYLTIRLAPEFGVEGKGGRRLVTLWNIKAPAMTQNIAAAGIYLKQQYLQTEQFADCSFAILDLRKATMFVADAIPVGLAATVAKEFAWVDSFFEQAIGKSEKKSGVLNTVVA